jgi:hypothetical protein
MSEPAVPQMTKAEAIDLTTRIKVSITHTWRLIAEAYRGRAWEVLGYESWDAYCVAEFDSLHGLRLPREERQEVVASLRDAGLSLRAISSATGISKTTAQHDAQVYQIGTPEPARVIGIDGKQYPVTTTGDEIRERQRQANESRSYPENSVACRVEKPSELIRNIKLDIARLFNPNIYTLGLDDLERLDKVLAQGRARVKATTTAVQ